MFDNHFVPDDYGILPYFKIFGAEVSTYSIFVGLGIIVGVLFYYLSTRDSKKKSPHAYGIVMSALAGGFIGSKIIFVLENLAAITAGGNDPWALLFTGKSIVGGLLGGYLGILIYKKIAKIQDLRFGNEIAIPVLLAMAIGRIGCFMTGCCAGIQVDRFWGIDFGDGVYRLPTQLFEMVFCLALAGYLWYLKKHKTLLPGKLFKKLIVYYLSFRFLLEFVRNNPRVLWIFTSYQIACILIIAFVLYMDKRKRLKAKEQHGK